jgi:hypothetical protein
MARDFNGSTDAAKASTAFGLSAFPVSISAWVLCDTTTADQTVVGIGRNDTTNYFQLFVRTANTVRARSASGGSFGTATSSATVTDGVWTHVAGVWVSSTNRSVYVNGANKVTDTNSCPFPASGLDRSSIGVLYQSSDSTFLDGKVANVGIWAAELNDSEVAALGKGFSPALIRPASLLECMYLFGNNSPETGIKGTSFTLTGTAKASSPRIYMPSAPLAIGVPAAGAPAGRVWAMVGDGGGLVGLQKGLVA